MEGYPCIYRRTNYGEGFTIESPCEEYDTEEFLTGYAIAEHKRIDSALVRAKILCVDDIYRKTSKYIIGHTNEHNECIVDSVEYTEDYADYMRNAQLSCLCVTKTKNKYVVSASFHVPTMLRSNINIEELEFDEEFDKESFKEKIKELENRHKESDTEKAETPSE